MATPRQRTPSPSATRAALGLIIRRPWVRVPPAPPSPSGEDAPDLRFPAPSPAGPSHRIICWSAAGSNVFRPARRPASGHFGYAVPSDGAAGHLGPRRSGDVARGSPGRPPFPGRGVDGGPPARRTPPGPVRLCLDSTVRLRPVFTGEPKGAPLVASSRRVLRSPPHRGLCVVAGAAGGEDASGG